MGLVTLLTDFGLRDHYVGVMKGVIYGIHPSSTIVDLTHDVRPQDIAGGRFQLLTAAPYFPPGTVHIAVVDPGVGTSRRSIALATDRAIFVGPDNGVLVLEDPIRHAVVLDRPEYWRSQQSSATFHGRDIFAAIGAHLAKGVPLDLVGHHIDPVTLTRLDLPTDCIQSIDHFGNCITTIPGTRLASQIQVGDRILRSVKTYGEGDIGEPIALIGSHNFIEIAIKNGNAQTTLNIKIGDPIICNPKSNVIQNPM